MENTFLSVTKFTCTCKHTDLESHAVFGCSHAPPRKRCKYWSGSFEQSVRKWELALLAALREKNWLWNK